MRMAATRGTFGRLPLSLPMEGFDARIGPHGAQRGHVEGAADAAATAGDMSLATQGSAVMGDGRDADQGGDFFVIDGAKLRQFGDQHRRRDLTDARHAFEDRLAAAQGVVGANGQRDRRIDVGELVLELGDVLLNQDCDRRAGVFETVFLRHDHLDHLAPTGDEVAEGHAAGFDMGGLRRPHGPAKLSNHKRVEAVRLGQPSARPGKVANPPRIDDRHRALFQTAGMLAEARAQSSRTKRIPAADSNPTP